MQTEIGLLDWLELAYVNIDKAAELSGLSPSQIRYLEELLRQDQQRQSGSRRLYTYADMPILLRAGQLCASGKRPHEIAGELQAFEPDPTVGELEIMRLTAEVLPRCILAVNALKELAALMELHQLEEAARHLLVELEKISGLSNV